MKKGCLLAILCLALTAWPVMAAETEEASSLTKQAQTLIEEEDYEAAIPLLREAAEKGDAEAQGLLGACYLYGEGLEQDHEEAVKYLQLAADQENAPACYCLGLCFENGWGV